MCIKNDLYDHIRRLHEYQTFQTFVLKKIGRKTTNYSYSFSFQMIRPTYIRFVVSSNQNPTSRPSLQGGYSIIPIGTPVHRQNFPQIFGGPSSPKPITPIIIDQKLNLSNEIPSVDKNISVIVAPVDGKCSKRFSSNNMVNELDTGEDICETNACKSILHLLN